MGFNQASKTVRLSGSQKSETIIEMDGAKCPLCQKPLATDEYHRAVQNLEKQIAQSHDQETKRIKREFESKIQEIEKSHQAAIDEVKELNENQRKELANAIESSYNKQVADLQKKYDAISRDNEKQFSRLEKDRRRSHEQEIKAKDKELRELRTKQEAAKRAAVAAAKDAVEAEIKAKDVEIKELRKRQEEEKKSAVDAAKSVSIAKINDLNSQLSQREIQIERLDLQLKEAQKQLVQSQSELKGEAGERDLIAILSQAFPQDLFRRQTRGISSADIIQQIRLENGSILDTPIVYDNKAANSVTKHDIEKAKGYQEVHGTDYVLIVSSNLPKEIKNECFGEKEGVILVHPMIVVEVTRTIRKAIVEISKQSASKKDRDAKEAKLYNYVKSPEFGRRVEGLLEIYQKMIVLQDKEEKAHGRLWRDRKALNSEVNEAYIAISSGIGSIIQETSPMEEFAEQETKAVEEESEEALVQELKQVVDVKSLLARAKELVAAGKFPTLAEAIMAIRKEAV